MQRNATLLFCLLVFYSININADATDDAALSAFSDGKRFFSEGAYEKAADAFRKAYETKPTWRLLFNIGQAEAAAKRYGPALEAFQAYLAEGGDQVENDRQKMVIDEIKRLRAMIGLVDIKTHPGATIYIDGLKRGVAPVYGGIPVTAGAEHEISVSYNGKEIPAIKVKIISGATIPIEMYDDELEKEKRNQPSDTNEKVVGTKTDSPADAPRDRSLTQRTLGWTLGGVGAAALAAGAVTGGLVLSTEAKLDEHCTNGICDEAYRDDYDRQKTLATVSTATLAVGATLAVTGIVLLVLSKRRTAEHLSFAPIIEPNGGGASVRLFF